MSEVPRSRTNMKGLVGDSNQEGRSQNFEMPRVFMHRWRNKSLDEPLRNWGAVRTPAPPVSSQPADGNRVWPASAAV